MLRRLLRVRARDAVRLAWIAAGMAVLSGCDESSPGAAQAEAAADGPSDRSDQAPDVTVAPQLQPATEPTFPADWCARAGSDEDAQFLTIFDIAIGYATDQSESCATSGLTRDLSPEQSTNWLNYLFGYTNAMTGCPLEFEPVEGGILAFGPANLAALGVAPPRLGRDDAAALIGQYLARFASALQLSAAERSAVEAYLWDLAQPEIDSAASQMLSVCGEAAPPETDSMQ